MRLSLCMIVRNEEDILEKCLKSIAGIADEIIIVDTGSDDKTKEVAEKYADQIYDYQWHEDFSAARNFAFSKAQGEYCMWLDADDVLSEESHVKLLKAKQEIFYQADMIMMPYHTAFDDKGKPIFSYYRERIVRNHSGFLFEGRVHEAIVPRGKVLYVDIPIEHRKQNEGDRLRNLKIYQKMEIEKEPFGSRALYYYGRELLAHGQYEKSIEVFKCFLNREDGWIENKIDATRQLAVSFYRLKDEKSALQALLSGLEYDVPRGESCCYIGAHFLRQEKYALAAYWYRQALAAKKNEQSGAFIQEECYGFLPAISLCVCYDRMGDLKKAELYNELAGKFSPDSEFYLKNKEYFKKMRQK